MGRAEQPEGWAWYKFVEESAIVGVSQTLSRHSLFLAGCARSVLVDYREERGLASDRRAINYVVLRGRHVLDAHENLARRSDAQPLFRDC